MFEHEYSRANDRIHPRQDLLKELEEKWAAETAQEAETKGKVVKFPAWARAVSVAAGILLCVGVGMGSALLYGRSRGLKNQAAQAPAVAEGLAAEEEAKILLDPGVEEALYADMATNDALDVDMDMVEEDGEPEAEAPEAMLTAAAPEIPAGTHIALSEAEVESALLLDKDRGEIAAKGAENAQQAAAFPAGELLVREALMAVFQPTTEQVHVVQFADNKLSTVFSLTLREQDAQIQRFFWLEDEFVAVQQKGEETSLLRFGVANWKSPQHRRSLSQSGTFLAAAEAGGRLAVLSLYGASEEEPLPVVDGAKLSYDDVLLDDARPGDRFTVLTVYDPAQGDGFVARLALLAAGEGMAAGPDGLLLWTEEGALYSFSLSEEGLSLMAEGLGQGRVLAAAGTEAGYSLLLASEDETIYVTLDGYLHETGRTAAEGLGTPRQAQIYSDSACVLADDGLHYLTAQGERSLALTGDGLRRLDETRLLVLSADGTVQLVTLTDTALTVTGAAQVKEGLSLLVEDPGRIGYDRATGRLAIPAGQNVYQFRVSEAGELTDRSEPLNYYDHDETDQRELRCLLTTDRALVFYKFGVTLCNQRLGRLLAAKY